MGDVVTVAATSSEGISGAELDAFTGRLPEHEHRRAMSLPFESRRCTYVLGRTLLRAAVARIADVGPNDVVVEIEASGARSWPDRSAVCS